MTVQRHPDAPETQGGGDLRKRLTESVSIIRLVRPEPNVRDTGFERATGATAVVGDKHTLLTGSVGRNGVVRCVMGESFPHLDSIVTKITQQERDAPRDVVIDQPAPGQGSARL
jgi:hypothetical protein